jgi:hypothetical protein
VPSTKVAGTVLEVGALGDGDGTSALAGETGRSDAVDRRGRCPRRSRGACSKGRRHVSDDTSEHGESKTGGAGGCERGLRLCSDRASGRRYDGDVRARAGLVRTSACVAPVLAIAFSACGSNGGTTRSPTDGRRGSPAESRAVEQRARPEFRAVVALEEADSVGILAGPPWRRVKRIRVARGPHNVDASPRGGVVAVTSPPADVVTC